VCVCVCVRALVAETGYYLLTMQIIAVILDFLNATFCRRLFLSLVFATLMIRTSLDISNRVPSAPVKKLDSTI